MRLNSRSRCLPLVGLLTILVGVLIVTACGGGAPDDGNRAVPSGPEQPEEQAPEQAAEQVTEQPAEQSEEQATEVPEQALGPLGSVVLASIVDLRFRPHLQAGEEIKSDVIVGPPWIDDTATIVGVLGSLELGGHPRGFELLVVAASGTTRTPLADGWWEGEQVEASWTGVRVEAVFFADVDGDATLEAIVLATYMTGIGATGAQPFFSNDVMDWVEGALVPLEPWAARLADAETEQSARTLLRDFTAAPPSGDRIAFVSERDGIYEIYVMNADGSGQTNLTNNPAWDSSPAWSPDGSRIAFDRDPDGTGSASIAAEIYVMNADGSGQTRLTNNPTHDWLPAWSPDGSRIAFDSDRDGNFEIYVMNADGSGQTRLTKNASVDLHPAWSTDGSRIAFDSDRDDRQNQIYLMDADGSGQTNLSNNMARDWSPDWSP